MARRKANHPAEARLGFSNKQIIFTGLNWRRVRKQGGVIVVEYNVLVYFGLRAPLARSFSGQR